MIARGSESPDLGGSSEPEAKKITKRDAFVSENEKLESDASKEANGKERQFPCPQCGASLSFDPSESGLVCPYCGHRVDIEESDECVAELDFHEWLERAESEGESEEVAIVRCGGCGAELDLAPNVTADECPFCGDPIVVVERTRRRIRPRALLPFRVDHKDAIARWRRWIEKLWFAPSALRRIARRDGKLQGVYVPYWTYDAQTTSSYQGARGDDYWTTETYWTTVNGRRSMQTRRVRRTRWRSVSGVVDNTFDDVLVLASRSLPQRLVLALEPWDLQSLVPYRDDYLSGFRSEAYAIPLADGFEVAKVIMDDGIRATIRQDIGGDHQRIHRVRTRYDDITFKHILLPAWVSAYRFRDKLYRFVVNARTGEVCGERPWSWVKIGLVVLAVLAVVGTIATVVLSR